MPKCKQCGLDTNNVKSPTKYHNNSLCKMCYDLNNSFRYRLCKGEYDKDELSKKAQKILDVYKYLVDTYHCGAVAQAYIPIRAKEQLVKRGYYNAEIVIPEKIDLIDRFYLEHLH